VDDPVDVGFAQDMKVHHAQAVALSAGGARPVAGPRGGGACPRHPDDAAGADRDDVGWLEQWGQTQAVSGPTMGWMGDGHTGRCRAWPSAEQLASLRTLPSGELEEQFLRLMLRHHAGSAADGVVRR
jgi:uncharacterized protein (DUF305 family)